MKTCVNRTRPVSDRRPPTSMFKRYRFETEPARTLREMTIVDAEGEPVIFIRKSRDGEDGWSDARRILSVLNFEYTGADPILPGLWTLGRDPGEFPEWVEPQYRISSTDGVPIAHLSQRRLELAHAILGIDYGTSGTVDERQHP